MYRLTEAELAVITQARSIVETSIAPHAESVDAESRFPQEGMAALAAAGFWGLTVPTEFGGMGHSLKVAAAVVDEIAQKDASCAMVYLMHLCGIAAYKAAPEACGDALRDAAAGKHLTTLAWSEAGSRSHFWAPISQAQSSGDNVVLNAKKSWVTSAGHADGYVVTTGGEAGGIDLYLVLKNDPGFTISGPWNSLGMRGNASAPMLLENCTIPASRRLGPAGGAFDIMMGHVLPQFQTGNAATSIGCCEAATQTTANHLTGKGFEHLGSKLADLPNLRARLAQMRIQTDMARAALNSTFDAMEVGAADTMLRVLAAKAMAADSALMVTDLGMKACGGAAFSKHLGLERVFRDARAMSVMAPTSDVLHDFIGKALCGMELFG